MDGARLNALALSETTVPTTALTFGASWLGEWDLALALACGGRQTGLVGGFGVLSGLGAVDLTCAWAAFNISDRLRPKPS